MSRWSVVSLTCPQQVVRVGLVEFGERHVTRMSCVSGVSASRLRGNCSRGIWLYPRDAICYGPVSIYVSVRHKPALYRNGCTDQAGFLPQVFLELCYSCVLEKLGYLKNNGTSFWNFVLRKFWPASARSP